MKTPKATGTPGKKSIKTSLGGLIQKKKANGLTSKNTPKAAKAIPDAKSALELCSLKPTDGVKSPKKKGTVKKSKSCPTSPEVELGLKLEALLEKTYPCNRDTKLGKKEKRKSLNPSLLAKNRELTPAKTTLVRQGKDGQLAKSPKKSPKTPNNTPLQGKEDVKKGKVSPSVKPASIAQIAAETLKKKGKSKNNKKPALNGSSPSDKKVAAKAKKMNKKALKLKKKAAWDTLISSTPSDQFKSKLEAKKVDQAVSAFKKYIEGLPKKSKELFSSPKPVFLQVTLFKIPQVRLNMKIERISLPHPYVNTESDICLLVGDIKKGKEFIEKSEDHYKALLEEKNINFINEIIPLKKFLSEYSQHEQKAKLCDRFDSFIVDAKVSHRFIGNLGKNFLKKRKVPVPVKLSKQDSLPKTLKAALSKTTISLNCAGHVSTAQIGHSQQNAKELSENIVAFVGELPKHIPGGWENIKSLNIKTDLSDSVPVYFSMKSPNEVSLPEIKKKKTPAPVEGEVSTFPGVTAVVYPSGDVKLKKQKGDSKVKEEVKKDEDDEEDSDMEDLAEFTDDGEDDDDSDAEIEMEDEESAVESDEDDEDKEVDSDDASSDNQEVDQAEQEYLKNWQDQISLKKVGGKRKGAPDEELSPSGKKGKSKQVTAQEQKQAQGKPSKGPQQPQGQKKTPQQSQVQKKVQNQQKGSPKQQKGQQLKGKGGSQGANKGQQQNGKGGAFNNKSKKQFKPNKGQNAGSPGFNKQKGGNPMGGKKHNKGKKGQSPGAKGRK